MPVDAFLLVIGAAVVHAMWNALIKADGDRLAFIEVMSLSQVVLSLCLVPFVAVPAIDSWPYLAASVTFNTAYMLALVQAYEAGELSLVYPLARGVAPFIVAIVSLTLLGEHLSLISQLAVLLIGVGIVGLASTRGKRKLHDLRPPVLALATGAFIAAYTIADGFGVRAASTPHGYAIWLCLFTALIIALCAHLLRHKRATRGGGSRCIAIASGLLSYASYWIAIWALTRAPIAMVSALRESGVVFAVVIGAVFLKEPVNLPRLAAIATTAVGMAILKLSS